MGLTLVTPPATKPVSLEEAKRQVGIHESDTRYDDQLDGYIAAATDDLDGYDGKLGYALMPQTWDYTLDAFSDAIEIPFGPVVSVSSVKYFDGEGVQQTVDADTYTVDLSARPWVVLNSGLSWPTTLDAINAVTIRFVAGKGASDAIKQAILLQVDHWFNPTGPNNRAEDFERAFNSLIRTKRRVYL